MDPERFDAEPDPTFYADADPDPIFHADAHPDPNYFRKGERKNVVKIFKLVTCNFPSNDYLIDKKKHWIRQNYADPLDPDARHCSKSVRKER